MGFIRDGCIPHPSVRDSTPACGDDDDRSQIRPWYRRRGASATVQVTSGRTAKPGNSCKICWYVVDPFHGSEIRYSSRDATDTHLCAIFPKSSSSLTHCRNPESSSKHPVMRCRSSAPRPCLGTSHAPIPAFFGFHSGTSDAAERHMPELVGHRRLGYRLFHPSGQPWRPRRC